MIKMSQVTGLQTTESVLASKLNNFENAELKAQTFV